MDEGNGCVTVVNWLVDSKSLTLTDYRSSGEDHSKAFGAAVRRFEQQTLSDFTEDLVVQPIRMTNSTAAECESNLGVKSVIGERVDIAIEPSEPLTREEVPAEKITQEHHSKQSDTALNEDSNNESIEEEEFSDMLQECYTESCSNATAAQLNSGNIVEGDASLSWSSITERKKCPLCLKNFLNLKRHIVRNHSNCHNQCHLCEKSYLTNANLKKHIKDVHGEKKYKCDQCDFCSKYSQHLQLHISAVHLEEKPHKCPQCEACFSRRGDLTRHVTAIHKHEKPFECSLCHKRFSQRVSCDIHWRSVHCGEKPYACDQCSYKCSRVAILVQHKRTVHDGVKRFPCSQCDFKTSTRSILKQHLLDIHGCHMPVRKRFASPVSDSFILSEDLNSTDTTEITFDQEKLNGCSTKDLMNESPLTENSLSGGCDSESRIKRELCAGMNYNRSEFQETLTKDNSVSRNTNQEHFKEQNYTSCNVSSNELNDNGDELADLLRCDKAKCSKGVTTQLTVEDREDGYDLFESGNSLSGECERGLHSQLNKDNFNRSSLPNYNHNDSTKHLTAIKLNETTNEDLCGIEHIEQEDVSDSNNSSSDNSSDNISDNEEFADLLQQCYPKTSGDKTRQQRKRMDKAEQSSPHRADLDRPCRPKSNRYDDNKTLEEENSIVSQAVTAVLNNIKSMELAKKGRKKLREVDAVDIADSHSLQLKYCLKSEDSKTQGKSQAARNRELKYGLGNQCLQCKKAFKSQYYLTEHIQRKHLTHREHQCNLCDKCYSVKKDLIKHVKQLHGDITYNCEKCECTLKYSQVLKLHISAVHMFEKPHQCAMCDSTVPQKGSLIRHSSTVHINERPYECAECAKTFSLRHYPDLHWRLVHCGERPYACDQREYRQSPKPHLKKHVRATHSEGERWFSCYKCDFRAPARIVLDQHVIEKHSLDSEAISIHARVLPSSLDEQRILSTNQPSTIVDTCSVKSEQGVWGGATETNQGDQSCGSKTASKEGELRLTGGANKYENCDVKRYKYEAKEYQISGAREFENYASKGCTDMDYNQYSNSSQDFNDSSMETLSQGFHSTFNDTFSQHSSNSHSDERLNEGNSLVEGIKQEQHTKQSDNSSDESGEEMSEGDEFSDLLHQCYLKSNSNIAMHSNEKGNGEDPGVSVKGEKLEYGSVMPPNRCPRCSKSFSVLTKLVRHIERRHSSERVYSCTHCDQIYSIKPDLTQHMKQYHGDQIYHCDQCDFTSRYHQSLKGHVSAVHLKEKPFRCPQCGSCFARKGSLEYHIRSVHEHEKRFQCPLCCKRLSSKQSLTNHYRVVHGQGEDPS